MKLAYYISISIVVIFAFFIDGTVAPQFPTVPIPGVVKKVSSAAVEKASAAFQHGKTLLQSARDKLTSSASTSSPPIGQCGQTVIPFPGARWARRKRVAGGLEIHASDDAKFMPWISKLQAGFISHICHATLIQGLEKGDHSKYLVTTARCIYMLRKVHRRDAEMRALLGPHVVKHSNADREISDWDVKAIIDKMEPHPNFDINGTENNIGIIMLNNSVSSTERIRPICMPHENEILPSGTNGYLSGWGSDKYYHTMNKGGPPLDLINWLILTISPPEECGTLDLDSFLCIKHDWAKGAGVYDDGAPFWVHHEQGYTLQGIVDIMDEKVVSYVRVAKHVKWINEQLEKWHNEEMGAVQHAGGDSGHGHAHAHPA